MNETILDATDELLLERGSEPAQRAVVREDECIGCTKCISACPTDAIIGASKLMHTVISDACSGCELCVPVCPVDCIDLVSMAEPDTTTRANKVTQWRQRYRLREQRREREQQQHANKHQLAKLQLEDRQLTIAARQQVIREAVTRAKKKKNE